eukprot:COSAG06_NODE_9782_length_1819_cov_1.097093_1_plen_97_part_10
MAPATTAKHGAKCLDGTPPAYAIRRGQGPNASRFIIFLEGGGWCFSVAECAGRRHGGLGSSKGYQPRQAMDEHEENCLSLSCSGTFQANTAMRALSV